MSYGDHLADLRIDIPGPIPDYDVDIPDIYAQSCYEQNDTSTYFGWKPSKSAIRRARRKAKRLRNVVHTAQAVDDETDDGVSYPKTDDLAPEFDQIEPIYPNKNNSGLISQITDPIQALCLCRLWEKLYTKHREFIS